MKLQQIRNKQNDNFEQLLLSLENKNEISLQSQVSSEGMPATNVDSGAPSAGPQILAFAAMIFAFYFLILRPQQKKEKDRKAKINELSKDDRVATIGGIIGVITHISEKEVTLKVDEKTKMTFLKESINGKYAGDSDEKKQEKK